ncbi:MAG: hypothetical protein GF400_08615 [Candidatus Eisenbacteria bacterium]|nr:hypothetical protein [Candidatus Eisenbacteria bacterium]
MRRLVFMIAALAVVVAVVAATRLSRDERTTMAPAGPAGDPASGVIIIGVDGLDWDRFERLSSEGALPNLSALAENGTSGVLRSIPPYVSPTIWTSIATGRTGEDHGVDGFTIYGVRGSEDAKLAGSSMIKCKTLWEVAAEAGKTSGLVGWLVTYPPLPVPGYTVSSKAVIALSHPRTRDSTDDVEELRSMVHPPDLWDAISGLGVMPSEIRDREVRRHLGETGNLEGGGVPDRRNIIAERLAADITTIGLAEKLMAERPTDLTAVYLRGCDIVSHLFWRYWEPDSWTRGKISAEAIDTYSPVIDRYYATVDSMVGRILEHRREEDVVLVCSDHGFAGHRGHAGYDPPIEGEMAIGVNMHRQEGVIIANGPGIASGERIAGATVLDVTPTVLSILGLPVARDMDGRPLVSFLEQPFLDEHPISYVATYETGDRTTSDAPTESPVDEQEKELLRSLGYID